MRSDNFLLHLTNFYDLLYCNKFTCGYIFKLKQKMFKHHWRNKTSGTVTRSYLAIQPLGVENILYG